MFDQQKIVISASRRTDIPCYYMDWFMDQIEKGYFEVTNPFSHTVSTVPATPDRVSVIVFWSKNFAPFVSGNYGDILIKKGFNLFFNFTVNSESSILEPRIPPLRERLEQVKTLCTAVHPDSINWRFDPITFFQLNNSPLLNNLDHFDRIADKMADFGISRCITSFMDDYTKIRKRIKKRPGFSFCYPSIDTKVTIITKMEQKLAERNISLYACCEKDLLKALPVSSHIKPSSCIPNDLFVKLFGCTLSLKKDAGQRVRLGCGCKTSKDIGSYSIHPCHNRCLYCYANPASM
ncbi:MAG: DUF1848 family protein [Pseudomonadota bacterium]